MWKFCEKCGWDYYVPRACPRCRYDTEPCDPEVCTRGHHLCSQDLDKFRRDKFSSRRGCYNHRDLPLDYRSDQGICAAHRKQAAYEASLVPSPAKAKCVVPGCRNMGRAGPAGFTGMCGCRWCGPGKRLAVDPRWTPNRWQPKRVKVVAALAKMGLEGRPYEPELEEHPLVKKHRVTGSSESSAENLSDCTSQLLDEPFLAAGALSICQTLELLDGNMHFRGLSRPRCSAVCSRVRCSMPSHGHGLCEYHKYRSENDSRVAFTIWALKQSPCAPQMAQDVPAMRVFLLRCLYHGVSD